MFRCSPSCRRLRALTGAIAASLALGGCLGSEGDGPRGEASSEPEAERDADRPAEDWPSEPRLVTGPPDNLIEACQKVARTMKGPHEAVYCPPVVPGGPVSVESRASGSDRFSYYLSLHSDSLMGFVPDADRLHEGHWVVAASNPARVLIHGTDESVTYPDAEFKSKPQHFTVMGVRATVLTGDVAGLSFMSRGHAIVYWQIEDTAYMASVHYNRNAPVAKRIARGLIRQMVECGPASPDRDSESCGWVFPTR